MIRPERVAFKDGVLAIRFTNTCRLDESPPLLEELLVLVGKYFKTREFNHVAIHLREIEMGEGFFLELQLPPDGVELTDLVDDRVRQIEKRGRGKRLLVNFSNEVNSPGDSRRGVSSLTRLKSLLRRVETFLGTELDQFSLCPEVDVFYLVNLEISDSG